jgi:hypothetical protein
LVGGEAPEGFQRKLYIITKAAIDVYLIAGRRLAYQLQRLGRAGNKISTVENGTELVGLKPGSATFIQSIERLDHQHG